MPCSVPASVVRFAAGQADVTRALDLRAARFRGLGPGAGARDADAFDARALHGLVEDTATGALACCFRLLPLAGGAEIGRSYAAQFYGLERLSAYPLPMVELGRFCTAEGAPEPDVLRLAWGAVAGYVAREGVGLLFGCTSFAGTDWTRHAEVLSLLAARHVGPERWRPVVRAPDVVPLAAARALHPVPDAKAALRAMPPLLRSYLGMGGWVSDHAVRDRDLGTLHVFTAIEVAAVPEARRRALNAAARAGHLADGAGLL